MFWADAVLCAVYATNMIPSHALGKNTPYEMWYGCLLSVRHLRVFGSTCYALIPKEKIKKLDERSQKCIFLGYSNTTKAYRLYNEVKKCSFFLKMCFLLNPLRMTRLLSDNLIILIALPM
jgi:hypothetical protein